MDEDEYPFPHGLDFGGPVQEEGKPPPTTEWFGRFSFQPGLELKWRFGFLDENGYEYPSLTFHGRTPKEAFEMCVRGWIFMNGGRESATLKEILPGLRSCFTEEGDIDIGGLFISR
jgi:hypothetical protein